MRASRKVPALKRKLRDLTEAKAKQHRLLQKGEITEAVWLRSVSALNDIEQNDLALLIQLLKGEHVQPDGIRGR